MSKLACEFRRYPRQTRDCLGVLVRRSRRSILIYLIYGITSLFFPDGLSMKLSTTSYSQAFRQSHISRNNHHEYWCPAPNATRRTRPNKRDMIQNWLGTHGWRDVVWHLSASFHTWVISTILWHPARNLVMASHITYIPKYLWSINALCGELPSARRV